MKFTGQVRFPDVDHPGIPVILYVEGNQALLVLDGESLGRWSLFDVQARRLVSSAFEVSFADEEITFIADNPMDFAYRGIEYMAEIWAGFKSRGFIRRFFSVKWSRRGTEPSILEELRQAMIDNLVQQPRRATVFRPAPAPSERAASTPSPEPVTTSPDPLPAIREDQVAQSEDLDVVRAERAALEAERARIEEDRRRLEVERAAAEREVADSIAAARVEIERLEVERAAMKPQETVEEPPAEEPPVEEVPADVAPESPPSRMPDEGELVRDVLATSADTSSSDDDARDLVVDLGELESADEPSKPEPAMAGASQKSGLMGAVRAAFSKNSGRAHVHDFVEAPAGIGIVRSICTECGYVSISTSD